MRSAWCSGEPVERRTVGMECFQRLDAAHSRVDQGALGIDDVEVAEPPAIEAVAHQRDRLLGFGQDLGLDALGLGGIRRDAGLQAHGVSYPRQTGGGDLAVGSEPLGLGALDVAAVGVVDAERDRSAHHQRQVAPILDVAHAAAQREVRHRPRAFDGHLGIGGFAHRFQQREVHALRRERR